MQRRFRILPTDAGDTLFVLRLRRCEDAYYRDPFLSVNEFFETFIASVEIYLQVIVYHRQSMIHGSSCACPLAAGVAPPL